MKTLLSILLLSTALTYSQTDFIKVLSDTDTVNVGDPPTISPELRIQV